MKTRILHQQILEDQSLWKSFSGNDRAFTCKWWGANYTWFKTTHGFFLKDFPHEAFTTKWIKHILQEQLKDQIVITEINGKANVVTFQTTTAKILQNFYKE